MARQRCPPAAGGGSLRGRAPAVREHPGWGQRTRSAPRRGATVRRRPIFAEHYHCDLCGGPVEQMGGDDDTYICAGDCAQGSCGEIVFDQARERLRAAWAAEQPPDEEEKDER